MGSIYIERIKNKILILKTFINLIKNSISYAHCEEIYFLIFDKNKTRETLHKVNFLSN